MRNSAIDIMSIEAKDIILGMMTNRKNGMIPRYRSGDNAGKYVLRKFINTLDYSLEMIKLKEVYRSVYRNRYFSWRENGHEYTNRVINVTFEYSLSEFNKAGKNFYVRAGYDVEETREKIHDCVAIEDGMLIGIVTDEYVENSCDVSVLEKNFKYDDMSHMYSTRTIKTIMSTSELRKELYCNGFALDGIRFVRFKRSSGSSRVGKCLFIDEELYKPMHKWELCGLDIKEGDEIDLAAFEAYISLTTSSIIDTMDIRPENILLVDDYDSVFGDDVIETRLVDGKLKTLEDRIDVSNSIWDGESLMDVSLFGKYSDKGMLLLRNQFFKSCCFNANIQKWFRDNNITDVSQLNGITRAERIEDVLLITTPNSIKYLKFGTFDMWLDNISPTFGIVKFDKPTHYIDGMCVQTHYQLINTLQFTKKEMHDFLSPTIEYVRMLKDNPDVMRYHIRYPYSAFENERYDPIMSKNDIFYKMIGMSNEFSRTKIYRDFARETVSAFVKNTRKGHVYVDGNYSTICGNPMELLQQSIGMFDGKSVIGKGNMSTTRFEYDTDVMAIRSPHICSGCVLVHRNVEVPLIDKYMNRTDTILYINSIGENILMQLAGADFDSDSVLITNNDILISVYKRNEGRFKIPTVNVDSVKRKRRYTNEQKCDLDIKSSTNKIGEIVNLSQELNSLYWDRMSHGADASELDEIYRDICQLSNMSGIEIDMAKKEFPFSNSEELDRLRSKYHREMSDGRTIKPYFFSFIQRYKGYYDGEKNVYVKHNTSMDFLEEEVNRIGRKRNHDYDMVRFCDCLKPLAECNDEKVNYNQVDRIIKSARRFRANAQSIFSSGYRVDNDIKFRAYSDEHEKLIKEIEKMKINGKTIYYMLHMLDRDSFKGEYNLIFKTLFLVPNHSFIDAINVTKDEMNILEMNDETDNEVMRIYGHKFVFSRPSE